MRLRIAVTMFVVVGVLAVALASMAFTDSPIPGWIAVGAVLAWGIGRTLLAVLRRPDA
jgi:protein-S-isoprenylcysteine O-methyltransferase Ste14